MPEHVVVTLPDFGDRSHRIVAVGRERPEDVVVFRGTLKQCRIWVARGGKVGPTDRADAGTEE